MKENFHESILLEGLKEGNVKIFDYLFHFYYSGLVAFSMKYVKEREIAEDLVQDFFFNLWLDRSKLKINQTLKAYFFTSIKNKSIDYIRHLEVKAKATNYFESTTEEITYEEQNFLSEAELKERIKLALDKLPEKCRQVFILNRFEGLKPKEIAIKENISVRTVETHIGKALKILRKELENYLPGFIIVMFLENLNDFIK